MDHESTTVSPKHHRSVVHYLERAERLVLASIAIILVVLAVLILLKSIVSTIQFIPTIPNGLSSTASEAPSTGKTSDSTSSQPQQAQHNPAIDILDGVLLVLMTMEIVYTVTLSLQSHQLVAEPFLIIGIIAAIRRTLVITAESSAGDPNVLMELGLLTFIVGIMSISIWILRRSSSYAELHEEALKEE